jgi:uncharacterized Zn-finger protein
MGFRYEEEKRGSANRQGEWRMDRVTHTNTGLTYTQRAHTHTHTHQTHNRLFSICLKKKRKNVDERGEFKGKDHGIHL